MTRRQAAEQFESARTVGDLPDAVAHRPALRPLADVEIPYPVREAAEPGATAHREFDEGPFWQQIPAFAKVDRATFLDPLFQLRHSVTDAGALREVVGGLVDDDFFADVNRGLAIAPMNVRITPYLLSLIDWNDPYGDPIRRQFLPVASTCLPDHPRLTLDSLHERADSPTPGLVHRYPDKVLFLPLDVCPVYCRFCTRSYAIGGSTGTVTKDGYKPRGERWRAAFAYLAARPEVEDVVVSGGDTYMLPSKHIRQILTVLLDIPHIRRVRIASKGPAVMPMKIVSDTEWTDTLCEAVDVARDRGKEVCLHTHFNSTREITSISRDALDLLFKRGVVVRNQSVLIRGVNDNPAEMVALVKQLSWMNVQPYYVYQHDMVKGVEELRTRLGDSMEIERHVRGVTAGFNTPTFVTDVPGGGGKRDLHSHDHYDEVTGVSVYRSPAVDASRAFLYLDPIDLLPDEGRARWARPEEHEHIVREALAAADLGNKRVARR